MKPRNARRSAAPEAPREISAPPPDSPGRTFAFYAITSVLLLVPCFWQSRIQAGDLSSHVYNTWLAREVATRHIPGVAIVPQFTNVMFDWLLAGLSSAWGFAVAQRVAVSLAVLVFFWGAFTWLTAVAGRQPRHLAPLLAILTFGWVFHAGFFNFYLSLGLCFWAMALAWPGGRRRLAMAAPLVMAAWLAHSLPVAWMAAMGLYTALALRLTVRQRAAVMGVAAVGLVALHIAMRSLSYATWSPKQALLATGMDQAWIYDEKYLLLVASLVVAVAVLVLRAISKTGWRALAAGIPVQLWSLTAVGIAIVPTAIARKGLYVAYIADRMSLPAAVCLCAVVGAARLRAVERYALIATALVFFGFLYRDDRILNAFEGDLRAVVARLPERSRVISAFDDTSLHVNAVVHMVDRACTGWCYSLANYEASTGNFRLRALPGNSVVAATYEQSWLLQTGAYFAQPTDLPLYELTTGGGGELIVRSLQAGERTNHISFKMLPDLF